MSGSRNLSDVLLIGETSSRMVAPDAVFSEVVNMSITDEGGYRSIWGVVPYLAKFGSSTLEPDGNTVTPNASTPIYGRCYGVHHTWLSGGKREVLLLHTGNQLWVLDGSARGWKVLIGPDSATPQVDWGAHAPDDAYRQRWPTQFVTTSNGVVIIPESGRMFFFDGVQCAPLGFVQRPAAPTALGPDTDGAEVDPNLDKRASGTLEVANNTGYAHHQLWGREGYGDLDLGRNRVGTIEYLPDVPLDTDGLANPDVNISTLSADEVKSLAAGIAGRLLEGEMSFRVVLRDPWGNMSAPSEPSNPARWDRMSSQITDTDASGDPSYWGRAELAKIQLGVAGISRGPLHTIGRDLYATKDQLSTGDTTHYLVPGNATAVVNGFATIPDRNSTFYPYNVPDSFLAIPMPDLVPTPIARLGAIAFGRLWVGNLLDNQGAVQPSMVGLYGTFPANNVIVPDPTGGEVTGMHTTVHGLLVMTASSTFLIVPNDQGDGFRALPVSTTVGCVAPSSIATTRDGMTIWLGRDGFYGYDGSRVVAMFEEHVDLVRQMNRAAWSRSHAVFSPESGYYECYVPHTTSLDPNRRYKWTGEGWIWDDWGDDPDDYDFSDSCVTADDRNLVVTCGNARHSADTKRYGVWAMDRGFNIMPSYVTTGWIKSTSSDRKASISQVEVWMRETGNFEMAVDTYRNYRADATRVGDTIKCYPEIHDPKQYASRYQRDPADIEGNPSFWDTATADDGVFRRRRPYWTSRTIDVPACECFRLKLSSDEKVEIYGLRFIWRPVDPNNTSARR